MLNPRLFLLLILFLHLTLASDILEAQETKTASSEMKATVLKKDEKTVKVLTKEGEKTLNYDRETKGLEHLKEGSKVTVQYEKEKAEIRAKSVEPSGSIGTACPCDRCPEAEDCKKKVVPARPVREKLQEKIR